MSPPKSRIRRILLVALKGTGALLCIALLATTITGRVLHARDERRWKAPGRLVDIGHRRLHIVCAGQGTPTIVLEAGLGEFSLPAWHSVFPQLAEISRTCAYDRAAQGWSDPPAGAQLATDMANDLHLLLTNSGERAPYILVGHSAGGPLVRHYATHYPGDVAGLVLLDGSHENQKKLEPIPRWVGWMVHVLPVVNFFGIDRTLAAFAPGDSIAQITTARNTRAATVSELVDFWDHFDEWLDQVAVDARPFGNLPLDVITAGVRDPDPGQTEGESEQSKARWFAMQQDIASRSTNSRWVIAEKSRHHIQNDEPALVIETVRRQVANFRAHTVVETAHAR